MREAAQAAGVAGLVGKCTVEPGTQPPRLHIAGSVSAATGGRAMEQTWRWFGPDDVVQPAADPAGRRRAASSPRCTKFPTAWSGPIEEIEKRKALIEADPSLGLRWSVVESLPVAEPIKLGEGDLAPLFDNYRQSLRNLAALRRHDGLLQFHAGAGLDAHRARAAAARRRHARCASTPTNSPPSTASCWSARAPRRSTRPSVLARARAWFDRASESDQRQAARQHHGRPARRLRPLRRARPAPHARPLRGHRRATALRENLARFLREVVPTAEEAGVRMCIHPDDPPRPLLGLPRIVVERRRPRLHRRRRRRRRPTASRSAPARSAPGRQRRAGHGRSASPTASISPICATSPRSRTARSWKPTIWAATSTWWRSSRRCCASRSAGRMPAMPTGASRCGPDHGHELLDDVGKRDPSRLSGDRAPAGAGRIARRDDRGRRRCERLPL